MKKLLAISFLLMFTGCDYHDLLPHSVVGPKFKAGDCMAMKSDIKRMEGEGLEYNY